MSQIFFTTEDTESTEERKCLDEDLCLLSILIAVERIP